MLDAEGGYNAIDLFGLELPLPIEVPAWLAEGVVAEVVSGAIVTLFVYLAWRLRDHLLSPVAKRLRRFGEAYLQPKVSKAKRYWPSILTMVAAIFTAIGVSTSLLYTWSTLFPSLVAVALSAAVVRQEYWYARKATYAHMMGALHGAMHHMRDKFSDLENMSLEEFEDSVENVLDCVAQAFSMATGTNCRACIKVITAKCSRTQLESMPDDEKLRELMVKTLKRNAAASDPEADEQADYITDNTDFRGIFVRLKRFFLSNNLPSDTRKGMYWNSHFPSEYDPHNDEWPLNYRSTFVWPIRKLGLASHFHVDHATLGFLCVDSRSRNVFTSRFDFDVGAAVADALFIYMRAFFDKNPGELGNDNPR